MAKSLIITKWPYLNAKVKDEIVSINIIPLKV